MLFNEYQFWTRSTAIYKEEVALNYLINGLAAEAGEVSGKWAKLLRDGPKTSIEEHHKEIIKELGDILWFVARLSDELGYDLNRVVQMNIDKLESRKKREVLSGSGDNR